MKKPKTLVVNSVAILGLTGIIGGLGGLTAFAATPSTVSAGSPTSHIEHHGKHHPDQQWKELASILKISPKTLHADLKAKETIAEIAQKQGISTQTLTAELEANFQSHLNRAVANGKITAAQEQRLITQFDAHVGQMINRPGFMLDKRPLGTRPHGQIAKLAKLLHLSPKTLRADLKAKETIAEIAQKQGISTQTLTAELEAPAKTHLVKAVANGKMTIAREQAILAKMNTRISNMLTRTWR
ncbi:hypothetical protein [Sulfoacidibacillus thermotolerans]|uniref:Uncharacterized protein n=1 Tax=Sulfoacidibacillus thermotolerans TaxID=1765684 RepID=A0A2U3D7P7_SULT2|nr:hypothetical protein [Sulfoacidibacillus thermotolerans]PWI57304.1 hypothetical protein BM613_09415 [Sulfoacidibacillus thermotolerans]